MITRCLSLAKTAGCSIVGQLMLLWRNRGYRIICPASAIGDIVFSAAVVRELKKRFPDEKFCILVDGTRNSLSCAARMLLGIFDRVETRCPPLPSMITSSSIIKVWPAIWKADCSDFGYSNCLSLIAKATDLRLNVNKAEPLRIDLRYEENWNCKWQKGKTVLICPGANSASMPNADDIWMAVGNYCRRKGLRVVFNAKDDIHCKGFDTVFYDVRRMSAFAEYCGYVISLRSGLADLLAYVTRARILAVYSHNLDDWYWTVSDAWRKAGYSEAGESFLHFYALSGLYDREGLYDCFYEGIDSVNRAIDALIGECV